MEKNTSEKRDFIFAVVFSALALLAFDAFFPSESAKKQKEPLTQLEVPNVQAANVDAPEYTPNAQEEVFGPKPEVSSSSQASILTAQETRDFTSLNVFKTRQQALEEFEHIEIKTPSLSGSIRLKGARFDNLLLTKYKQTLQPDSKDVVLFSPTGTEHPFFAEFGWISNNQMSLPNSQTNWQTQDKELSFEKPVTLTWENEKGLKFIRQISVDENYMFSISDRIENHASELFTLFNYGLIGRTNVPPRQRGAVLEGMVGFLDGSLKEYAYAKMEKEKEVSFKTTSGWAGITDKYWMAILAFDQKAPSVSVKFSENETKNGSHFQADYMMPPTMINPGQAIQTTAQLFAGAKDIRLIDSYAKKFDIPRFDLTVDFGWYYFLTKPFFFILSWLYGLFGNMGLAILFFAFVLRLLMFPIANKSFESMAKMKELQPQIEALKLKCGDDKVALNQEMMMLYKKNEVNPAAGCLPMLIQIPVFFSLYKVLYISLELRQAPFYGWIHDLSAPDPSSVFTLFGLIDWNVPSAINIGVWPVLMGLTMWAQQQMNPKSTDKTQNTILAMMPLMMTFLLGKLASGLIIYWTWSNLLSIAQQYALKFKGKKGKSEKKGKA